MPNITLAIYVSDEQYIKYLGNKKEINKKARDAGIKAIQEMLDKDD